LVQPGQVVLGALPFYFCWCCNEIRQKSLTTHSSTSTLNHVDCCFLTSRFLCPGAIPRKYSFQKTR
jgi:hypothetical protein